MNKRVVIIGGGAAGFFAAVNLKRLQPEYDVCIVEKTQKLLAKVRISGGGRCNVTHACFENSVLTGYYPRGAKALRGAFSRFSTRDTVEWFQSRGVNLHTEEDGRMFPETNQSETIVRCLMEEADRLGVRIKTGTDIKQLLPDKEGFSLQLVTGAALFADKVLIATGGSPKAASYDWLTSLGHSIQPPVPSLFTFNVPGTEVRKLMGLSVPEALIRIEGLSYLIKGPLLITHWGFSGPAVLKLSAWASRELKDMNYNFKIRISWIGEANEEQLKQELIVFRKDWNNRLVYSHPLFNLPRRLWEYLLDEAGILPTLKWAEMTNKNIQNLTEKLIRDTYAVNGKTTFKDEFVTCGGIKLSEVDFRTMESKIRPNLYFAGEVLDIDGLTGGFNFQSAWTTGWIAAHAMSDVNQSE